MSQSFTETRARVANVFKFGTRLCRDVTVFHRDERAGVPNVFKFKTRVTNLLNENILNLRKNCLPTFQICDVLKPYHFESSCAHPRTSDF